MTRNDTDVLIAGGGFAGLTLAVALKQALGPSFGVTVADPALGRTYAGDERASAIVAAARRLFETIGVWDAVAGQAQPILDMVVTDSRLADATRPTFLTFGGDIEPGEPFAHMIENHLLVEALEAKAREHGVVLCNAAVAKFSRSPQRVDAEFADPHTAGTSIAGAHGRICPYREGARTQSADCGCRRRGAPRWCHRGGNHAARHRSSDGDDDARGAISFTRRPRGSDRARRGRQRRRADTSSRRRAALAVRGAADPAGSGPGAGTAGLARSACVGQSATDQRRLHAVDRAKRPRYHLHYTPTYASWLNQVERWFGLITQQAIRRGSFRNVGELVQKIEGYVAHYNLYRRPFVWTATADSILAKLKRLCKLINGTSH